MKIGGLQKLSLIDYPNKVAAVVFTVGCNFRCGFCHNPELVSLPEPQNVIFSDPRLSAPDGAASLSAPVEPARGSSKATFCGSGALIPEKDLFDFLEKRVGQLDGVCVTGGEPTLQPDLAEFLRKIKSLGGSTAKFAVKLDTNGTNPEVLEKLIKEGLVDYVAMDIKASVGAKIQNPKSKLQIKSKAQISKQKKENKILTGYEEITGTKVDLDNIKKSAEIIKKYGAEGKIDYEFRTTVLPKFHKKEDLVAIGKWLASVGETSRVDEASRVKRGKVKKYFLQQFRPEKILDESLKNEKPYSLEELREFCRALEPYFEKCEARG